MAMIVLRMTRTWSRSLNGAPGVFSARYAGEQRSAADNMDKLLQVLSQSNRNAQFKTVVTLNLNGKQYLFTGIKRRDYLIQSRKRRFRLRSYLSTWRISTNFRWIVVWIKNQISHRGKATQQLISFWKREVSYQILKIYDSTVINSPTLYPTALNLKLKSNFLIIIQ
jgi:inosine/xanthosine triphosphate pyrophosphatase family protein